MLKVEENFFHLLFHFWLKTIHKIALIQYQNNVYLKFTFAMCPCNLKNDSEKFTYQTSTSFTAGEVYALRPVKRSPYERKLGWVDLQRNSTKTFKLHL